MVEYRNMPNGRAKVIVITDASSGLGEATAKHLAAEGAVVALAARRRDRLEKAAYGIKEKGGKCSIHVVDVTKEDQLVSLVDEVVKQHGKIDVMVNNAGLMALAPIAARKVDEWNRMIGINIKGVLYGVAAALPYFEKQGSGHVINIASVGGLKVSSGGAVYCATKFAVRAFTEGLRQEMAGKLRVTTISPGYIESELMYGSGDETVRKAVVDAYKENAIPADTIASAIAYAISQPDNTSINEIVIRPTVQEF